MSIEENKLFLIVSNVRILQPGLIVQHAFDINGGVVGSDDDSIWILHDDINSIQPKHFEIFHIDNSYCLKDLCGQTYINGSDMPLGIGNDVRLQHKDEIKIGAYLIRIQLSEDENLTDDGSLEEFISKSGNRLLDGHTPLLETKDDHLLVNRDGGFVEPLKELDKDSRFGNEKIQTLDYSLEDLLNPVINEKKDCLTPQADSEFEISSSMKLKKILGFGRRKKVLPAVVNKIHEKIDNTLENNINVESFEMDDNNLEILEQELAKQSLPENNYDTGNHLIMGPLLNGLQVNMGDASSLEGIHKLGEEIGESLKACIQGILDIHTQVEDGRFGVINRNLQPIEDNPLRLGLNYEDTIKTLFDTKKSMVHLSPPAAIEESLKNIRNHNQAMQEATSEALQHILMAFSPEILLKRFNSYKRNNDTEITSLDSWAWNMYQSYFTELTSNRQRGFDKLFWEIFEQSYDRRIRKMQLEQ